jgi:hypothetical protein
MTPGFLAVLIGSAVKSRFGRFVTSAWLFWRIPDIDIIFYGAGIKSEQRF